MQDYHKLEIWNRAMAYAVEIYRLTAKLPAAERYYLASQFTRAATSVPLNIAEGCGCSSKPEFARFLGIAYRSLKEIVTCLELTQRLYPDLAVKEIPVLIDEGNQISRMTRAFMQRLGGRNSEKPRSLES